MMEAMSAFELACRSWYFENVGSFALEAGLISELVRGERMRPPVLKLFVRALNMIHAAEYKIVNEMIEDKRRKS